jgi:hypothetical protein
MIETYDFGAMIIDGQKYAADLIILPRRINPTWWRKEGHRLSAGDLQDVFGEDIEVLVVGTGFLGKMQVQDDVLEAAQRAGISLIVDKTKKAVELFNQLSSRKKTAGAFHLTC